MKRRISLILILGSILLMAIAWSAQAANITVNVNVDFGFVSAYPECPVPRRAVIVEPRHKHLGGDWTEYRVDHSTKRMILMYQDQMPRNGWRYDHEADGAVYWVKGHRLMRIMIIWVAPHRSIVAFSETRIRPAYEEKEDGYKGQWHHGKHGKKHHGGYKEDEDD